MNKFRKVFDHKMWLYDFARVTGCISSFFYLRLKRIYEAGKKPKGIFKGKYLVCPNHCTYLDPIKIMHAVAGRRVTFMATKTIYKNKFVNWLFDKFGCVKVEGTNVESFKKAIETLNRGHIVALFPEASVKDTNEVRDYKSGMAMLAFLAEADILPIYIGKRKKWYNREVAVIGNKIKLRDYIKGKFPTMDEINHISEIVRLKELDLKKIYDEYVARREKKRKHETK